MPKLNVYNISKLGVNTDKAPPYLEDGELPKAQNAIGDGIGEDGGLRKRAGLVEFNGSAAAGSVVGGIGVPLSQSFNATRTMYLGREQTSGSYLSLGWNVTADNFATVTTISSGTPANPRGDDKVNDFEDISGASQVSMPGVVACIVKNVLYYAGDNYTAYPTAGHSPPTIRSFDGTVDRPVCKIPYNIDVGAATNAKAVLSMLTVGNLIYIATFDGGTGSGGDFRGRVFSLDPNTGVLVPLGSTFTVGYLPYCMTFYQNKLWVGTSQNSPTATGKVFWFRPSIDTAWTLDHTTTASKGDITAISSYQGELYISTRGTGLVASVVKKRNTSGTWSEVDTNPYSGNIGNTYLAMATFNNILYVCAYKPTTLVGTIRQFNGTAWSDASASSSSNLPVSVFVVDNGTLYGLGITKVSGTVVNGIMKTTNGTSWTYPSVLNNGNIPAFGVITS